MKVLSRWLFLCLTIILMSLSFFHLSARLGSIYYFSSIDRVESTLSQFDLSVRGFESVSYTHLTLPTKRIV